MEDLVKEGFERFLEYGIVGLGWPFFLYAVWEERKRAEDDRKRSEERRRTDIELIERTIAQTVENTQVLQQLVRVIDARVRG